MKDNSKYNPKKHHRKSIRLKGYDYSQAGLYFITICCQDRVHHFGNIKGGEMILNEYGQIAFDAWMKTPEIRNNVELGAFIVMPNHVHGIIRLLGRGELHSPVNNTESHSPVNNTESHSPVNNTESHSPVNENESHTNGNENESHSPDNIQGECNSPLRGPSQTIGAIIRGYKSSVTKQLGLMGMKQKLWQRNYYENIIRDEKSFQRIKEYIENNPSKWNEDRFYSSI